MNQPLRILIREQNQSHFRELDKPEGTQAAALYAYWCSKRPDDGDMPRRADMRFDDLVRLQLADSVYILEPTGDGADWCYRLIGSMITQMFGVDATGQTLREVLTADEASEAVALTNRAAQSHMPLFLEANFVSGGYTGSVETMSLPVLAPDGATVWVFGGTFFDRPLDLHRPGPQHS